MTPARSVTLTSDLANPPEPWGTALLELGSKPRASRSMSATPRAALENAVRTGTWCSYRSEAAVTWDVDHSHGRRA